MIFLAGPPVYTLPGTWNDPDKIAKCNDTLIPHFTFNPDYTFGISIAVITVLLAAYGIYKGFFANKNLRDPWDEHDDYILYKIKTSSEIKYVLHFLGCMHLRRDGRTNLCRHWIS